MLRNRPVFALVAWTFLIWTTRIGNIWRDDELDTAAKWGRTGLALSFTVLAAAVIVAFWYGERSGVRRAVLALCGWTVAVWAVRSVAIVLGDWSVGFKTVHVVLAVVSIALSVVAVRSLRNQSQSRRPTPSRKPTSTASGWAERGATNGHRVPASDSGSHRRL
jgi:hypothetical protein